MSLTNAEQHAIDEARTDLLIHIEQILDNMPMHNEELSVKDIRVAVALILMGMSASNYVEIVDGLKRKAGLIDA